jgi:hypothetical protein
MRTRIYLAGKMPDPGTKAAENILFGFNPRIAEFGDGAAVGVA